MTRAYAYFSPELFDLIIQDILAGDSVREILSRQGMPSPTAFYGWLRADGELAAIYTRARVLALHVMENEIIDLARTVTPENVKAARVKFAILRWMIGKRQLRCYRPGWLT